MLCVVWDKNSYLDLGQILEALYPLSKMHICRIIELQVDLLWIFIGQTFEHTHTHIQHKEESSVLGPPGIVLETFRDTVFRNNE